MKHNTYPRFLLYLIGFLFFFPYTLNARHNLADTLQNNVYYSSLRDKLTIYTYGTSRFNQFELVSPSNTNKLIYKPNSNFNVGLGISYKWIGFSTAFNLKFINNDSKLYGETQNLDLQFDIYGRKMIWTTGVQFYQGFYWANVNDYYSNWNILDSVPQRPDIATVNANVSFIYCFNHRRYSFKALFTNSEWQKRSAGSWLAGAGIMLYGIEADSSIIPTNLQASFPRYDSLRSMSNVRSGATFGYTYTLVIKEKVYFNAAFMLGLSLQTLNITGANSSDLENESKLSPNSHIRLTTGYNSERNYFGISLIADSYLINRSNAPNYTYSYGKFRIFYGRRFNVEKIGGGKK